MTRTFDVTAALPGRTPGGREGELTQLLSVEARSLAEARRFAERAGHRVLKVEARPAPRCEQHGIVGCDYCRDWDQEEQDLIASFDEEGRPAGSSTSVPPDTEAITWRSATVSHRRRPDDGPGPRHPETGRMVLTACGAIIPNYQPTWPDPASKPACRLCARSTRFPAA